MSFAKNIENTLNHYGSEVKLWDGDDFYITRAFVEPLRYKTRLYIGGEYRNIKEFKKDSYLYVGKASFKLVKNHTVVDVDKVEYKVVQSELYEVSGQPVYQWALLVPVKRR